ncbi:MAG: glutamate racemase [Gammaproteobacteria bacterium]|nr:glutamate racemase [Gammaproteobacteria bacterium]
MLNILVFDSGVGGLSISHRLADYLPMAELILLSDNAYFPYGEKDDTELIMRVSDLLCKAELQLKPDCIVIACNTASTVALETIRKRLQIPIIGVVPAIKPAAEITSSKVVGLLATPATVNRSYTADLINKYADGCTVVSVGSTRLVEIAEMKLRGQNISLSEVSEILNPFIIAEREYSLDTLILGCTHFPLLSNILEAILPQSITLVDSSSAIARQVINVLNIEDTVDQTPFSKLHQCFMTKMESNSDLNTGLLQYGFKSPEIFQPRILS